MKILLFAALLFIGLNPSAFAQGAKDIHNCIEGTMKGNTVMSVISPTTDPKEMIDFYHLFIFDGQLFKFQLDAKTKAENQAQFCVKLVRDQGTRNIWVKCQSKGDCQEDIANRNQSCSDDKRVGYTRIPDTARSEIFHAVMGICFRQAAFEVHVDMAKPEDKQTGKFYADYFENYNTYCSDLEQYVVSDKDAYIDCKAIIERIESKVTKKFGYKFIKPLKVSPGSKSNTKGSDSNVR